MGFTNASGTRHASDVADSPLPLAHDAAHYHITPSPYIDTTSFPPSRLAQVHGMKSPARRGAAPNLL